MQKAFCAALLLAFFIGPAAQGTSLEQRFTRALKYPNARNEGLGAVQTFALTPLEGKPLPGFSELTDYALAAPDQEEAGTCLYMSLTGIVEWWLARLNPSAVRAPNGDVDLSERFAVNESTSVGRRAGIKNWKTDSIELFNRLGFAATNRSYPFTKGYVLDTDEGYVATTPSHPDAIFGTQFNWIDELGQARLEKVKLPHFSREVLYADPTGSQWDVGVAPDGLVELIKERLKSRKAPVQVIYNHYGYWHATVILGYDDQGDSKKCHFVEGFRKYMRENPLDLRKQAAAASSAEERDSLINQARNQEATSHDVEAAWTRGGGCVGKGVFYVRDSIYGSDDEPVYDYNPAYPEGKGHYSKRIITLEYEWVKYLANHALQITAQ